MAEQKLGKYPILGELGRGAMGIVYQATDPDTGRKVAIKVLPSHLASDPTFVNRFRREVVTLQRLDHPGTVSILDHGVEDGAHFYVMEYVEGWTLEDRLEKGRMDPLETVELMVEVSRALEHIHALGIVHRDLKPSNIMLTEQGRVVLTDFGIAKLTDATRMTATRGLVGTVEYMSPEQSQGRFVDPRSDIYSLGIIIYRCITGRLPVTGATSAEILTNLRTKQIEKPIEWLPQLSPAVNDLIMSMVEKDPARRVPSAKALTRELQRARERLKDEKEGRRPEASANRIVRTADHRKPPGRARKLAPFAALALLAGLAALIYASTRPGSYDAEIARAFELYAAGGPEAERQALALLSSIPEQARTPRAQELYRNLRQAESDLSSARRLYLLAGVALNNDRLELARDLYRLVVAHFPDTALAEKAAGKLGAIEHRLGRLGQNANEDQVPEIAPPEQNVSGEEKTR